MGYCQTNLQHAKCGNDGQTAKWGKNLHFKPNTVTDNLSSRKVLLQTSWVLAVIG